MNEIAKFKKDGLFLMAALDHRTSLKKMINRENPNEVSGEEMIEWKKEALKALTPFSSAVLLDPEFGLSAYKELNLEVPFLLSMEESGYKESEEGRETSLEYSASELKKMGGEAVKLLVYYNAKAGAAIKQKKIISKAAADCEKNEIPFLLEIVSYDLGEEKKHKGILTEEAVEDILRLGAKIDIFKIEFPGNIETDGGKDLAFNFCRKISAKLGKTPWILLSAGDDFSDFKEKVKIAIKGGAKGFLAGRSLWKDFTECPKEKRTEFFERTVKRRFQEIIEIARESFNN
ncbi:MAG: tagatose 1,6-diphosphate aldolase [Candidatus Paceibacterota bacterium]